MTWNAFKERFNSSEEPIKTREFTATARTYRVKSGNYHDEEDRFQCPNCGRKQPIYFNDDNTEQEEQCCNCGVLVWVKYRIIHRRNF